MKLESKYSLSSVDEFKFLNVDSNYLVLFGVNNIPPHIGFVSKGKYYSDNSSGGKRGYDFSNILKSVDRKKIPTLLISIEMKEVDPEKYFRSVPLNPGESCLTPIKNMMIEADIPIGKASFVFDLLNDLLENDLINKVEHLHCSNLISDNIITLEKYSQEEIDQAINDAKRLC